MKTPETVLKDFHQGRSTAGEVILEVLYLRDCDAVDQALEILPADVLKKLKSFVAHYSPKTVIIRGPRPEMSAVERVRSAFRKKKTHVVAKGSGRASA